MPKKATPTKSKTKRPAKPAARKPAESKKLPRPPVPGLLPVPPEVLELLEQELKNHPVTDKERKRLTNFWTLQYYYGGEGVVYRNTPQGVEILAVGEDITTFFRTLPPDAPRDFSYGGAPDPW